MILGTYSSTSLLVHGSQKVFRMQSGDATTGWEYSICENENKQLIALLNAYVKKVTERHIMVIGRDWTESDMRELRHTWGVCSKAIKRVGNFIAVSSVFLWPAVFCMTATHSSVFAFLYLVYALTRLNLTLTKCIFYRKPCITLKQIWSPDKVCLANVFSWLFQNTNLNSNL